MDAVISLYVLCVAYFKVYKGKTYLLSIDHAILVMDQKRRKEKENEIFHRKRNGDQKEKKTHTQCDNRIALER